MPTTTVLSLEAELLDLPVDAAFQIKSDGTQLYVVKGVQDPENKVGVDLNTLIEKLGNTVTVGLTQDTFKNALPATISDSVNFYVEALYLVINKSKTGEKGSSNKFAFKISMDLEDGLMDAFIVELKSLNFMIWTDTVSEDKLQELGLTTAKNLLAEGNDA